MQHEFYALDETAKFFWPGLRRTDCYDWTGYDRTTEYLQFSAGSKTTDGNTHSNIPLCSMHRHAPTMLPVKGTQGAGIHAS